MKVVGIIFLALVVISAFLADARSPEEYITYVFYSRTHLDGIEVTIKNIPDVKHIRKVFNSNKPTIVLIHGFKDGYGADSNTYVRKAILSKTDANIIKVDWSPVAGGNYLAARNAVPNVGRYTGRFLQALSEKFQYSFENVTIVGFSLGAHAAGNVGKQLAGKLPQIVGLDPAGPLISASNLNYSLHKTDAQYVQVIHTDGGGSGMTDAIGHSDFYPNGGQGQPGCLGRLGCSHNRAWAYYAETITHDNFQGKKCKSFQNFERGLCTGEVKKMGGIKLDKSARGVYYLAVNRQSPFGRG